MDEKDTASRKWQLTFNNPEEHGWTHDKIREVLRSFKTMAYWCMADEIGAEEKTPH
ncbi:MAG: replication protein, partial [Oscillibacter sp.]|nr:replication protein [Oscillibacter sp.]